MSWILRRLQAQLWYDNLPTAFEWLWIDLMRSRRPFSTLRLISLAFLAAALILSVLQLVRFSRVRAQLPNGMIIAGVPVGGMSPDEAAQKLRQAYALPVELYYDDQVIHLEPQAIDFQVDVESMLALASLERTETQFWQEFWDFLWGRQEFPSEIPLSASYSEERLRAFLQDIALRYDQPAQPALPIPGSTQFKPGAPGRVLDIDTAIIFIEGALSSLENRRVVLPLKRIDPPRPAFENLEILLKQTLTVREFDGLAGVYLMDLQHAREIHFAWQNGEDIPVNPDIAFTASSIIKIPIMVSAFRRIGDNPDGETLKLLEDMIDQSGNEAADWLMNRIFNSDRAPLEVTEDMRALGLQNTFLAGYFTLGSPLLAVIQTPANQRTDVFTDPDPYSQTTPSDIGMLLEDIYQCAQNAGSALMAVFGGEITREECQRMNTLLLNNRLPVLLTAGLPEATPIAHKHGWVTVNGIINTIGDAGIIYSPGGNYILVVFLYHPEQLVWEPASELVAELSKAVYNYFNIPSQ